MIDPPRLKVLSVDTFEHPFTLRLPFRFGVVTVTEGKQAFVRVRVRLDDQREAFGYAAETLAAKWFDKDPSLTDEQNRHQLRKTIELAAEAYLASSPTTAFELSADNHRGLFRAAAALRLPPLVAGFGPALLDRAVMDAVCRIFGASFSSAMRSNLAGLRDHLLMPDLTGLDWHALLAPLEPQASIEARHTVGLLDPIVAADQADGTRVDDGLPETLDEVVERYGQRCFKLKVSGDRAADLDRLTRIAGVLDPIADKLHVTLDGNEQYDDVDAVVELWSAMEAEPRLQRLCASTLFIEQPVKRQAALSRSVGALGSLRPVMVDESDGDYDAFVRARALGYTGISSKNCKGFYRSIVNLARCRRWNTEGDGAFFMSGEDLTTLAGLSVQQDLALVSLLGLADVERNGHHFVDGFRGRPTAEADAFAAAHPDLYTTDGGRVRLRIEAGRLALGSLECKAFGSTVVPDLSTTPTMPRADWPPGSVETIVAT